MIDNSLVHNIVPCAYVCWWTTQTRWKKESPGTLCCIREGAGRSEMKRYYRRGAPIWKTRHGSERSSFSHTLLSFSPPSFLPTSVWRRISFTDWTPLTSSTRSGNWEWCSLTTWVWPRVLVCDSRGLFALSTLLTETDKDLGLASCKCLCSHEV